ncbi:MAG TPA: CRTAC1 family protein [Vicinamibacteria bacterium]|nr:CRTAC1 family protein [Vicinamibacteria bacterium]
MSHIAFLVLVVGASSGPARAAPFGFTNVTASSRFFSLRNLGGHGVQVADATGDGFPELYVTNIFAPNEDRPDLYFVNLTNGSFREQGAASGVSDDGYFGRLSEESHAAIFADLDNDGDYDLFNAHTWSGNHKIYRNDGMGTFTDVTPGSGIELDDGEPRGVAAGDVNGDGVLDLVLSAWENLPMTVYLGRGSLRFERRSLGSLGARLANQGIALTDLDNDFDLDLATTGHMTVGSPIGPLALFANDGRGRFTDVTAASGIRFPEEGTNGWSFGDLDGDGDLDVVLVSNFRTKIFFNEGSLRFRPGQEIGRGNFTAALGDFDHDGDLDIYIGGTEAILENDGRGGFSAVRDIGIVDLGRDGRGTAVVDFDRDGDLDIAVASKRGSNTLFRNDRDDDNWLEVRLVGPRGDAGAFGAKVYVYDERHVDDPSYLRGVREARGATGYCSQDEPVLHFGVIGGRKYEVKAIFLDGSFFIAKGVSAPGEVLINPSASLSP